MDERPLFEPDSFEERMNSLRPIKTRKTKDQMRRKSPRSPADDTEGPENLLHETHGTRWKELHKDVKRINSILNTRLAPSQETEAAIRTVQVLRQLTTYGECDSPILRRVMSKVESKIEGEPEWMKTFLLGGLKVSWIVARRLAPGFSSAEAIWNAIEERDLEKLAVGMVSVGVTIAPFPCFSWLLGVA